MTSTVHAVPVARSADLVTTESGTDVLVYDQRTHHIHHLNPTTTAVWHACDGERSVAGITTVTGAPDELVRLALAQLADAELLAGPLAPAVLPAGQSRRRFLKRAAGAVAVPVLVSVTAPTAAQAASLCGRQCVLLASFCGESTDNCTTCVQFNPDPNYLFGRCEPA